MMIALLAADLQGCVCSFSGERDNVVIDAGHIDSSAPAYAVFHDHNQTSAQFHLLVQTNATYSSSDQAYFAGFAEGYITGPLIQWHNTNLKEDMVVGNKKYWDDIIIAYSETNFQYVRDNV